MKAVLLDLDGTLVNTDMSVVLAEIVNKQDEVRQNNLNFHNGVTKGLTGLISSINLLKGVSVEQIEAKLNSQNYLMPGAIELLEFIRENRIISILASGGIIPTVEHFQKLLKIDYAIGSRPKIENGVIIGISEDDYSNPDFKLHETKKILKSLHIDSTETVAIGDSPGDKSRFEFAAKSIAINPKGGIEVFADYVIEDDLSKVIPILKKLISLNT